MLDFTGFTLLSSCALVVLLFIVWSSLWSPPSPRRRWSVADTGAEPMPDGGSMTSLTRLSVMLGLRMMQQSSSMLQQRKRTRDSLKIQPNSTRASLKIQPWNTTRASLKIQPWNSTRASQIQPEHDAGFAQDAQVGQDAGFPSANRLWSQIGGDIDGENTNDKSGSSVSFTRWFF